jgi:uncharacterized protein (DUF302 family)
MTETSLEHQEPAPLGDTAGVWHVRSSEGVARTAERITDAARAAGLEVFATIDHRAAALAYGLVMPSALVILYGHPKGGTPAMVAAPDAALELPLRVLVRDGDAGEVIVAWRPVGAALRGLGVPAEVLDRLESSQRLIREAVR